MSSFQCLKIFLQLTNYGPENVGNCIWEGPMLKNSRGSMPPDPDISSCTQHRACGTNGSTPPAEPLHPVLPCANKNPASIVQRASLLALYILHYTFSQFHLLVIKRFTFETSRAVDRKGKEALMSWGARVEGSVWSVIYLFIYYFVQF